MVCNLCPVVFTPEYKPRLLPQLLLLILFLLPGMRAVAEGAHPPDTLAFFAEPLLSRPADSSVTVTVVAKKNMQVYYEYGTAPGAYTGQTAAVSIAVNAAARTVLSRLRPDTRYYYRLRYKISGSAQFSAGDELTFMTRRAQGSAFTFGLISDSHLYDKKGIPALMQTTMQNLYDARPDFIIDLGDTFGDDHQPDSITQQEMMQLHLDFLPYITRACKSSHFYFCLGNHEGENGYYLPITPPNNMAVYGTLARKFYYSNPVPGPVYTGNTVPEDFGIGLPENYYAWEWGDALFVVLDVYRHSIINPKPGGWDWTLGEQQYFWFKNTLETSRAKYKFVFAHHVRGQGRGALVMANQFEWGGYEQNGRWGFTERRPGWPLPIHQLMVQNGVQAFFQGHDHLFAQEMLDGVAYQEVPMPSDSTYMIGMLANADAYTANQLYGSGHLLISISPAQAKIEYVRAFLPRDTSATRRNKEIAFSYIVAPRPTTVKEAELIPGAMELEQNYPNPFNPETQIQYTLGTAGTVTISSCSILGEEAALLVNGYKEAGRHRVTFRPGSGAPSGIYLIRLTAGGKSFTKKAMYIK